MTWLWIIIVFAAFVFIVGTFVIICQRKDEAKLELEQEHSDLRYMIAYAKGMFMSIRDAKEIQNANGFAVSALEELEYMQRDRFGSDAEIEAVDA